MYPTTTILNKLKLASLHQFISDNGGSLLYAEMSGLKMTNHQKSIAIRWKRESSIEKETVVIERDTCLPKVSISDVIQELMSEMKSPDTSMNLCEAS